jgi:flagellar hook assembly protein FlgD
VHWTIGSGRGNEYEKADGVTSSLVLDLDQDYHSLTLTIYDRYANLVNTLNLSESLFGKNTIEWDGTNSVGRGSRGRRLHLFTFLQRLKWFGR